MAGGLSPPVGMPRGDARVPQRAQGALGDRVAAASIPSVKAAPRRGPEPAAGSGASRAQTESPRRGWGGSGGGESPLFAAQEGNAVAENGFGTDTVPGTADTRGPQGAWHSEKAGNGERLGCGGVSASTLAPPR